MLDAILALSVPASTAGTTPTTFAEADALTITAWTRYLSVSDPAEKRAAAAEFERLSEIRMGFVVDETVDGVRQAAAAGGR